MNRRQQFLNTALAVAIVLAFLTFPAAAQKQKNPGISNVCGTFQQDVHFLIVPIPDPTGADPDEGWAYVDSSQKLRTATGIVHDVHVAAPDTPANHDSHDVDFQLRLDPNQEDLITPLQTDSLGIEWENGLDAIIDQTGDGKKTFPRWAWPSDGDRIWIDGNWVYDCGHPVGDNPPIFHAEIHPPRAIATMRDQAAPLPGTGTTPVPVTLTDVYITGRGGYAPQILNCGLNIILGDYGDSCGQSTPPPDFDAKKYTPINDTNFNFKVCLPPRPANTVFSSRVDLGPDNTVSIDPNIRLVTATAPCVGPSDPFLGPRYDQNWMLDVTINLNGTPTPATATYARRVYAGWVAAPDPPLAHRHVTLNKVNLFDDHDTGTPGELSFWWIGLNVAPNAWFRLSDHTGDMSQFGGYIDDSAERTFTGVDWDFYLRSSPRDFYRIVSNGYDQDCSDQILWLDGHYLNADGYIFCWVSDLTEHGANDALDEADALFATGALGNQVIHGGDDYDLHLTFADVPLTNEDTSDLGVSTSCTAADEVPLVGRPVTCTSNVANSGPGLPRAVGATSTFTGTGANVTAATWAYNFPYFDVNRNCTFGGNQASCAVPTVPASGGASLSVTATPTSAGNLVETAAATTTSTDPVNTNNSASTTINVFQGVTIDVQPGDPTNVVELRRQGLVTVAILSTPTFDARTVDPSSVCFGDGDTPAERSCAEVHGRGHLIDVNNDKVPDLVLHYDVLSTGIDPQDAKACLKGKTTSGTGIYGCDAVAARVSP